MRREEVIAVGELSGEALAALTAQTEEVHRSIAGRVWSGIGPLSLPVRLVHDGIARTVYGSVRLSVKTAARGAGLALSATTGPEAPALGRSPRVRRAVAALNGALGDRLAREESALALPMTLRAQDEDVEPTAAELARCFPQATGKLAVFLHGLGQSEEAWRPAEASAYGSRLRSDLDYTPVYVRYNSGRPVEDNGRELARLLEAIIGNWPTEVEEVALVGHSTGGLLARSACHHGAPREWIEKVRHVFTLATPHEGAPIERLLELLAGVMARLPETRPLARAIELRSAGWRDFGRGSEVPFAPGIDHYFISGQLSPRGGDPLSGSVGDAVVLRRSAWAQRFKEQRVSFPIDHYRHLAGTGHLGLLRHPAVYEQIRRWLDPPALPAPVRALPRSTAGDQRP